MRPLRTLLALLAVAGAASGCASAGRSWRAGPAGIPAETRIRGELVAGNYSTALELLKDKDIAPADALLRHLYKGVVAVHAGQHELGTRAMDRAWEIAYQRYTRRLSDQAAGLVTGEGAIPYDVEPAERLLIPYYGGLNWLARNERDDVAVEARRMAVLLASEASNNPNARYMGVLRYINGVMFEAAGERNDADVAYRNAAALLGSLPADTVPPDSAHGDVVVFIEDGFVVRPEPNEIDFWLTDEEVNWLQGRDDVVRQQAFDRVYLRRGVRPGPGARYDRLVSIRWPSLPAENVDAGRGALGARATAVAAAAASGDSAQVVEIPGEWNEAWERPAVAAATLGVSVSDAVRTDFERAQPGRLMRALARAKVRDITLDAAGNVFDAAGDVLDDDDDDRSSSSGGKGGKGSKKGGDDDDDDSNGGAWVAAGLILLGVGLLAAHVSSQVLDQADLRAWQLLPDRVTVARMRLPVGDHVVEVTRDGEAYSLGTVTVRPGSVTVLAHRWWPGRPPVVAEAEPR